MERSEEDLIMNDEEQKMEKLVAPQASPRKYQIVYFNVVTFTYGHLAAMYGIYLACTSARWYTLLFNHFLFVVAILGITAGVHRLWTHRSYKAKMPLQILLMIFNCVSYQNTALDWVRDHRLHHRYSDTDADPHNATRGLFYSQMGWLMVKKHEEVKKRGKFIDMSDAYANPVLMFQKKYSFLVFGTACFLLPTIIPMYFWGETLNAAWHVTFLRWVVSLHITFLVNSVAHCWGAKPYDTKVLPSQCPPVSFVTLGEGFHNYHHVYPWDYRTAELGNNKLNFTTWFIDFFAWVGWAYDLKTVPDEVIRARAKRTGDGTDCWGMKVKNSE